MKNIYIAQDLHTEELSFIGNKEQLQIYLKDGSLKEGDTVYTVNETRKVEVLNIPHLIRGEKL